MRIFAAIAVACGVFAAQAYAQKPMSAQDFASKVAISDMFEIDSSKLAENKGNAAVKSFAQHMVKDHSKTSQELKGIASKAKLKLPSTMDAAHQKKADQLRGQSGDQFNAAYARMQVEAHEEAVKLFEGYSTSGDNPELRVWAGKTLPALQKHLEMAKELK